jgi:broad specificity phosphatase PhoE
VPAAWKPSCMAPPFFGLVFTPLRGAFVAAAAKTENTAAALVAGRPRHTMVQSVYILRHAHRFDFEMSRDEWQALASRSTDPPLSALGQWQATEAGRFFEQLGDESITHVLASPYLRCIQTAHPIANAVGAKIKVEVGVQEIQPSFLRGAAERHLDRVVPSVPLEERAGYFPLLDTEYSSTISGDVAHAADARGIQTRHWLCVQRFLEASSDGESVVIVTHGWVRILYWLYYTVCCVHIIHYTLPIAVHFRRAPWAHLFEMYT